jgi:molybdopterin synthase sulfur carrier subunit
VKLTVLYFASLREAVGCAREDLTVPPQVSTAGALRAYLRERDVVWRDALAEDKAIRMAVDQAMAHADTALREGAEVAFFPPVTGG